MLYRGGKSIGEGDCESGSGVGSDEMYNSKTESALVPVLDLYSEDKIISVCDSRPSSSPAYTITDYLSTAALKEKYTILT